MSFFVYRIAQSIERAQDLSGFGAFRNGGRWNSKGTYMLYTSMNSSLAFLENLVHFDESVLPPGLFIATISINTSDNIVFELPIKDYPKAWQTLDNLYIKRLGDQWMADKKFLAVKVRSAVNTEEYNYLLNPLYPGFFDRVAITAIKPLNVDSRLIRVK